jgi:precorrin-6Y C5,15-methyltransferase (decarboxylating)
VINAVTLESEALLIEKQRAMGGQLMRFDISSLNAIGTKRGWKAAYPVVQWSVTI